MLKLGTLYIGDKIVGKLTVNGDAVMLSSVTGQDNRFTATVGLLKGTNRILWESAEAALENCGTIDGITLAPAHNRTLTKVDITLEEYALVRVRHSTQYIVYDNTINYHISQKSTIFKPLLPNRAHKRARFFVREKSVG